MSEARPRAHPLSAVRELVLHALAWIPATRHPASLYEPAYHRFARETLAPACVDLFAEDGPVFAPRLAPAALLALHALPMAFDSTQALVARARAEATVTIEGVDSDTLARCRAIAGDLTDWLLCDCALAAAAFERTYEQRWRPALALAGEAVQEALARAHAIDPRLRRYRLSLSCVLGPRGRSFADRSLVVGAPGLWSPHSPEHCAVQWLHECAVTEAPHRAYVNAEWHALTSLARRVEKSSLETAHARWIAGLELSSLVRAAIEQGLVLERDGRAVLEASDDRAGALRRCARR